MVEGAQEPAPIEIRYRSNRAEIWRWYGLIWRRRWPYHLLVLAAPVVVSLMHRPLSVEAISASLAIGAAACALMAIYPQLAFKSEERWLKIGPDGVDTVIGSRPGHRDWREIGVKVHGDAVVLLVQRSGNAFIIPGRAFASPRDRGAFLLAAARWTTLPTDSAAAPPPSGSA